MRKPDPPGSIYSRFVIPSRISAAFFCLLQVASVGNAQQPVPGPGPIGPRVGPESPPVISVPPEESKGVPIGRLEGYEEEKRKALEVPFQGRPPGAVQEDPAVRHHRTGTGLCGR